MRKKHKTSQSLCEFPKSTKICVGTHPLSLTIKRTEGIAMLAAYLQEDVAISIKIGRFLPTCNGGVGGRSSENAAYLEKTCTQLSKIVFSSPVCFLK